MLATTQRPTAVRRLPEIPQDNTVTPQRRRLLSERQAESLAHAYKYLLEITEFQESEENPELRRPL